MLVTVVIYNCVLCFFGDEATKQFNFIFDSICELSFNEFPLEAQKLMLIMIITSEKPIYIQGFMNTQCTREMLKRVRLNLERFLKKVPHEYESY